MGLATGAADPRRLEGWAIWSLVALFVAYYAIYILRHCDFNNDDLDNFLLMRRMALWPFLLTPTDVHFVPGHRLLTWLVYHLAPMNFGVAVAVLMAFHVGTLVYLNRICRLLALERGGQVIVGLYAVSCLVAFGLIWWAHAQHRAPYVFLGMVAVFHYLAWLRRGGRSHIAIAAICTVLAMAFYEKAVLIPVHMLVFGWLTRERPWGRDALRLAAPPLALLCVSALYVVLYIRLNQPGLADQVIQIRSLKMAVLAQYINQPAELEKLRAMRPLLLRWHLFLLSCRTELEFLKQMLGAVTGLSSEGNRDLPLGGLGPRGWLALCLAGAFASFSVWKFPRTWVVLLGLPLVLALDFAPIAFSSRGTLLGFQTAHFERFLYEEWHIVALFAVAWWHCVLSTNPEFKNGRLAWSAALAGVAAYGVINAVNLHATGHSQWSMLWFMNQSHDYAHNLRAGLSSIDESRPSFVNSDVPKCMSLLQLVKDTRTLLPLYRPDARFDAPDAAYRVAPDGRIVGLSANTGRAP
ncbi:hypothetical protein DVT68_00895 [Dyella solisilvae]|uniref:Glycosyltransferase RgtA/B/C/D-like domain-containing protein n=1 Tax=Dyella solisilvae TaxID=1920168 RepID=A0A370K9X4_9GAMM|nr:hypothetical protein [Dyella solisilvae]RDI99451.1 hypothetical protein DVT68_00895 [Dyella solisilvae]